MSRFKKMGFGLSVLAGLGLASLAGVDPSFAVDEAPPSIETEGATPGEAATPPAAPPVGDPAAAAPEASLPAADPLPMAAEVGAEMVPDLAAPSTDLQPASTDEYLIQSGDTLWDVSGRFFGKSEYWPKLWSFNQYITNPHYIFPGNRLVFKPGTETEPPSVAVKTGQEGPAGDIAKGEAAPVEGTPEAEVPKEGALEGDIETEIAAAEKDSGDVLPGDETAAADVRRGEVTLREDGYISPQPEKAIGMIVGATNQVNLLAEGHEIYIKFSDAGNVQIGDRYTVFRQEKKVKGIGFLNKVLGFVEVIEMSEKGVKTRVLRSYYPMERGDRVKVFSKTLYRVPVIEASNKMEARIVERLNYDALDIGYGDTVYIDKGNKDGVEAGYEFLVIRRGDGLTFEGSQKGGQNLPEEIVGKVVVVVARNNNSTAVVTYSTQSLYIGDRLSTQLVR